MRFAFCPNNKFTSLAAIFLHELVRVISPGRLTYQIPILFMLYRARVEIMSQILGVAVSGTTKTRIMYQAYLSYNRLTKYLDLLLDIEYLEFDNERKLFKTTAKGLEFLKSNNEVGLIHGLSGMTN